MKKKLLATMMVAVLAIGTMTGCGSTAATDTSAATEDSATEEAPAEESAEEPAEEAPAEEAGSSLAGNEITVVSREDGSGTRGAFIELTGVKQDDQDLTTVEAIITNSTEVMMTTVAGDENAIGYASMGSMNDTVKAVQ